MRKHAVPLGPRMLDLGRASFRVWRRELKVAFRAFRPTVALPPWRAGLGFLTPFRGPRAPSQLLSPTHLCFFPRISYVAVFRLERKSVQ